MNVPRSLLAASVAWLVEPPVAVVLHHVLSIRENVGVAECSSGEIHGGEEIAR